MAEIVVLTPEQLTARDQSQARGQGGRRRSAEHSRIIAGYTASLHAAEPGDGGDVRLAEGEAKQVVRQHLQAAAAALGLALAFRPVRDPTRLHFRVITPEERAARPRRGGRPRKQKSAAPEQVAAATPVEGSRDEGTGAPKRRSRRRAEPAA